MSYVYVLAVAGWDKNDAACAISIHTTQLTAGSEGDAYELGARWAQEQGLLPVKGDRHANDYVVDVTPKDL